MSRATPTDRSVRPSAAPPADAPAGPTGDGSPGRRIGEWIVVVLLAGVAALVFQQIATDMTAQGIASGGPYDNAAVYPRSLASLIAALVVVRVAGLVLVERRTTTIGSAEPRAGLVRAAVLLGAFALYIASLGTLGYALATPAFALVVLLLCGERRPVRALAFAVGVTVALSFVFESLLSVVLPRGRWDIGLPW